VLLNRLIYTPALAEMPAQLRIVARRNPKDVRYCAAHILERIMFLENQAQDYELFEHLQPNGTVAMARGKTIPNEPLPRPTSDNTFSAICFPKFEYFLILRLNPIL
jgi:hypothetical protein